MKTRRRNVMAAAVLLSCLAGGETGAAELPGPADPSRARGQIAPSLPAPAPAAPSAQEQAPESAAPEGADKITFFLKEVTVEGMTVYTETDIAEVLSGKLGRTASLADLYALASALTVKYRNDGYLLSQVIVPEQEIEAGRARLLAVEGFIDKVSVRGAVDGEEARLLSLARSAARSRPLNNADLERAVLLANDLPGVTARTVLGPSASTPGAADLILVVERKSWDATGQTDNRGSRYIGPVQATGALTLNNALKGGESLSLQLAGTPFGRAMKSGTFTWTQPVGAEGMTFALSGGLTETRPAYILTPFGIHGTTRSAGLTLSYPLLRARQKTLTVRAAFDWLDSNTGDNLGGPRGSDRLRVLRLGTTCQSSDTFAGGGSNTLGAEISKGFEIWNASEKGDANMTRAAGDPGFLKATLNASRTQEIAGPWSAQASVSAQKSAHLLLSSEEFGLGGASFGSAYDSSELTGEDGIAFRAELRRLTLPASLKALQLYGFYDIGQVWNRDDTVARHRLVSLADAGLGFRLAATEVVSASLEFAQPLTRPVAATGQKSFRAFFSLSARF